VPLACCAVPMRGDQMVAIKNTSKLALPWQIFQFEEPIRIPESIFQ